jgi:hypothetical protein
MEEKRTKVGWSAPRSGGYSARSATTGTFRKKSGASSKVLKPAPPKGRGSASEPARGSKGESE